MSKKPAVSIIILNYNGGRVTHECIESVLQSGVAHTEILLVDNASAPSEIISLRRKYGKSVRIIANSKNVGYAQGNNIGAKESDGTFLVFLNNDAMVTKGWLSSPLAILEDDPTVAFVQPKVKWKRYKKYFEYAGGAGGFIDMFGYPFVRGRIFGSIEEDVAQYEDQREIFWASGVALVCRKSVFEKLGGFDSFFFTHGEEEDLCFRAWRAGYRILYTSASVVFHIGAYTGNRNVFQKTFYNHRNHLILLLKNLSAPELIMILPLRMVCDFASMVYYVMRYRSIQNGLSVILAYFSFLIHFPRFLKSRFEDPFKNFGYPKNPTLVFRGSIAAEYFLKKRRKWAEIFGANMSVSKLRSLF